LERRLETAHLLLHFMLPERLGADMEERLLGLLWDSSLNSWSVFSLYAHYVRPSRKVDPRRVPWPMRVALRGQRLVSVGAIFAYG